MLFENKGDNILVCETEAFDFPCHLHINIEIMVCTEGTLEVSCNEQERTLCKGDIMISFPDDIHSYKKTEFGKGIMIIFHPNISELITSTLNNGQYSNFLHEDKVVQVANDLYHYYSKSSTNFSVIYGYLHIIFGMVLKKIDCKKSELTVDVFHSAVRYISLNYTNPISLKKVSENVGISQCHLSRIFSDRIDGGFKNYLKILRVDKAKSLLKTTDLSIYDIMMESGFSDQRTFNRVFKSMTAMTPREFRLNFVL